MKKPNEYQFIDKYTIDNTQMCRIVSVNMLHMHSATCICGSRGADKLVLWCASLVIMIV